MQIKMLYMIHSRFNFIIMIVNVNNVLGMEC